MDVVHRTETVVTDWDRDGIPTARKDRFCQGHVVGFVWADGRTLAVVRTSAGYETVELDLLKPGVS